MKKRVAIFGGGAHTIPGYRALLEKLNGTFDLTVYSEFFIKEKFGVSYRIKCVPSYLRNRWFSYAWFFVTFAINHLTKKYSLIHSHSTFPSGLLSIIFKKIFRLPVIVSLDAAEAIKIESIDFGDLLSKKRRRFNSWVIKNANVVTALTKFQADEVIKVYGRTDIKIIPRGYDLENVQAIVQIEKITEPITFLHVGYLHPVKGIDTLLRCFQLLLREFDCKLLQVGQDYMNSETKKLARQLGIENKVEFLGFIPNEKISKIYTNAQVLLHTSLFESQAFVVNEAMAHGLLVIGTDVGLLNDLNNECCITAKPDEATALSKKVIETLRDEALCDQLRGNAIEWTKEHDLEWTYKKYLSIYESCLNQKVTTT